MNEEPRAPEPRIGCAQEVSLEGYRFALDKDGHVLFNNLGDQVHLPLFRDLAAMGQFHYEVNGPGLIIEQVVEDPGVFLRQIPPQVVIVLDPHRNAAGRWEYLQVHRD